MFGSTDFLSCFPVFKQMSQFQKNLIGEKATIFIIKHVLRIYPGEICLPLDTNNLWYFPDRKNLQSLSNVNCLFVGTNMLL